MFLFPIPYVVLLCDFWLPQVQNMSERDRSQTLQLRKFNNWVKNSLITQAINELETLHPNSQVRLCCLTGRTKALFCKWWLGLGPVRTRIEAMYLFSRFVSICRGVFLFFIENSIHQSALLTWSLWKILHHEKWTPAQFAVDALLPFRISRSRRMPKNTYAVDSHAFCLSVPVVNGSTFS